MNKISMTVILVGMFMLSGCNTIQVTPASDNNTYDIACGSNVKKSKSPWNVSNLYNCQDKTMFIPYQLWTGMDWDGDKNSQCMHKANSFFTVNRGSDTTITGPKDWVNHEGKVEQVWHRNKTNGSKQQYFTCHENGIGRVYDSRRPDRHYLSGRCKFPAGYGWEIGKRRECTSTAIEIIRIDLDSDNNLSAIEFKWWYESSSGYFVHDHTYRYKVGTGMTNAWKQ